MPFIEPLTSILSEWNDSYLRLKKTLKTKAPEDWIKADLIGLVKDLYEDFQSAVKDQIFLDNAGFTPDVLGLKKAQENLYQLVSSIEETSSEDSDAFDHVTNYLNSKNFNLEKLRKLVKLNREKELSSYHFIGNLEISLD